MRTGEEENIRVVEWQSTVRRHASFCSQARRHRPLSSQGAPPDLIPLWVIPLYTLGSPSHPGHRPPTLRARQIFPLPQPLSLLISFLPTLFPYNDLSRCFFSQRF